MRFLYDDEMLYVGAMLYDDEPDRLIINSLQRDFSNFQTDSFLVVLDTFLDRRSGYGFNTNAAGAQRDGQTFDNGRRNDFNWNGAWIVRSAVLKNGWSTEIAVPFTFRPVTCRSGGSTCSASSAARMNSPLGRRCLASFRITLSDSPGC